MGLFRCLTSSTVTNQNTGADLGTSTTTTYTLTNTPVIAGTLSGTIVVGGIAVQTFTVDNTGAFTFHAIGSPSNVATAGTFNVGTGKIVLTWNSVPGANYAIVSYTGLPVYKYVTMLNVGVSCPPPYNSLCNPNSTAYVAASVVCSQSLFN